MNRKNFALIFAAFLFLLFSKTSFANVNTTIDVSNNGANSKNTVDVENNTGGNTISGQSFSKVHTSIKINTNGVEKTYESDKPEDINIQSDNGNIKINIKNSVNSTSSSLGAQDIENKKASVDAEIKAKKEEARLDREARQAEKRKQEALNKLQKQKFDLGKFIEQQFAFLKNLFKF